MENRQRDHRNARLLALMIAVDIAAYYGTRLLNAGAVHHTMDIRLDGYIPFVPAMVVFYVSAFPQWVLGYLHLAAGEHRECLYIVRGVIIAKLICIAVFLCYPTWMADRPVPTGGDIFSRLTAFIFSADVPPDNLFPSIHCLESWICLRITLRSKRLGRGVRIANAVLTALVFASVVLIKQHVVVDIPAGVAVAELGLLLSGCFDRKSPTPAVD